MADCTKKMNQKLTLLGNFNNINTAEHATEYAAKHVAEHAALLILNKNTTSVARTLTKDLTSVAKKTIKYLHDWHSVFQPSYSAVLEGFRDSNF